MHNFQTDVELCLLDVTFTEFLFNCFSGVVIHVKEFLGEITANESKGMAKVTPSRLKISDRAHLGKIISTCFTPILQSTNGRKNFLFSV